jgi:hypothetical protein
MELLNDLLPLLMILLVLPIVLFLSGKSGRTARRAAVPLLSVIFVFFTVSAVIQPAYRYKDLLFAFFSLMLLIYSIKNRKSGGKT